MNEAATANEEQIIRELVDNASLWRETFINRLIDPRRDINAECGYPTELNTQDYKQMYDREGVATRVVNLYPEESWCMDPCVVEDEDPKDTDFEKAWKALEMERQLYGYMLKADKISGIGCFGILLLGMNDGKPLSQPVDGINEEGEKVGNASHDLLYVRAFDECQVRVDATETNINNPRFGKPTSYTVSFINTGKPNASHGQRQTKERLDQKVHWTRVIHIAEDAEVYAVPRMQTLFNRLYDIRKIAGGSGEMFWKGGFPGLSFEMDPNAKPLGPTELEELRTTVAAYADGLQRYLTLQGITAKSLTPQVADPGSHIEVQLELISIALGVPKRVFMGSEQAQLSSSQDTQRWHGRVSRRQNKYLTPYIIRPTIDRLQAFGTLPEADYRVIWPDLDTPSEKDKAEVMRIQVEALSKYVAGNVDQLIPPENFLSMFADMDPDQVKEIMDAALERERELEGLETGDFEEDETGGEADGEA